jgi:protein-arginine kinase activator protein McsA
MLCEKCQAKPATVHTRKKVLASTGEALTTEVEHHFCDECGREFLRSSPDLKQSSWSKPSLELKIRAEPNLKPVKPGPPHDEQHDR